MQRILQQDHVASLRRAGGVGPYELLTHRKRIAEKLNLHGTADLILYAVRKGIIPGPPSP